MIGKVCPVMSRPLAIKAGPIITEDGPKNADFAFINCLGEPCALYISPDGVCAYRAWGMALLLKDQ